jgi:hypothetical protein
MLAGFKVGKFKEENVFLWVMVDGFLDQRKVINHNTMSD